MVSPEFLKAPDDFAVLTRDAQIPARITSAISGRTVHAVPGADPLLGMLIARRMRTVVVDRDCEDAQDALRRIGALPARSAMLVILVVRDTLDALPHGADVIVHERALGDAVALVNPYQIENRPRALDALLAVTLLAGPLDQALELAALQLATGFGVDRCLIAIHQDSIPVRIAERCRASASSGCSLIAPVPGDKLTSETYLAVPFGPHGFLALIVTRAHRFNAETDRALQAAAIRLAAELNTRAIHEHATEELDRLASGPGLDPLLAIWNNTALKQLAAMQVSSALRNKLPVSVAVLDVDDLQAINNQYGLEVGDLVLRRIADAVRTAVREEDVIGRWSGDAIAIVLHGIGADGAQRVSERLRAALDARAHELPSGQSLAIPATIGIATHAGTEGSHQLMTRAANAAQMAQVDGQPIKHATPQPATSARATGELEIGDDISSTLGGTYRLLHEISRGGMGVVYRAHDRALERPVAIKMLRPDLAEDAELVERFRIEASLLAHIQHPNLVQIYSFGHSGGDSYFVMELVEGESIEQAFERHRLEGTTMSLIDVPLVIEQIAQALDALHERGIVHRDVKPANVIRDPFRNRSVLVDVGIARRYGGDTRTFGTPGFVAPEVLGDGEATARSDVYGLAATAYTMLTLARPWGTEEEDLETILGRQCADELKRPSEIQSELAVIDDILVRALSSDPQKRPASAGAFARELNAGLAGVIPRASSRRKTFAQHKPLTKAASGETPRTRGVVFRSVPRALGVREAEKLRDSISSEEPALARALSDSAPLEWVPTDLLSRLLAIAPQRVGRDPANVAREIARESVRSSFRRFFPASAATLVPETTLSAIRNVWGRYQSWGTISSMPVHGTEVVVRLSETLREAALCVWTVGMLEQLVVLSGGKSPTVVHDRCEATGHDACLFRVTWER